MAMKESVTDQTQSDPTPSPGAQVGTESGGSGDPSSPDWDPFRDDWERSGAAAAERSPSKSPGTGASDDGDAVGGTAGAAPASDAADPVGERERGVSPAAAHLASREAHVSSAESIEEAIAYLLEHRARGRGRIIGIAGLPRHGKSAFAQRLRVKSAQRPGTDLRYYNKTRAGDVNMYYIPGRTEHHVLVDMAGEDFQSLGDYARDVPDLVRKFLWPILRNTDGLILMMALPIVWQPWNPVDASARPQPTADEIEAMRREAQRMVDAHVMLLKYALVAEKLDSLRRRFPELGLREDEAPGRNQVDDAFRAAGRLRAPVALAFSKADLYRSHGVRRALFTPDIPRLAEAAAPPLHPRGTDPMLLGRLHFPDLFEFLLRHVRHFKFDFVQVLEDPSDDPFESRTADVGIDTMIGVDGLFDFLTGHAWAFPGVSTAMAVRLDRLLRPSHWREDALATLRGV